MVFNRNYNDLNWSWPSMNSIERGQVQLRFRPPKITLAYERGSSSLKTDWQNLGRFFFLPLFIPPLEARRSMTRRPSWPSERGCIIAPLPPRRAPTTTSLPRTSFLSKVSKVHGREQTARTRPKHRSIPLFYLLPALSEHFDLVCHRKGSRTSFFYCDLPGPRGAFLFPDVLDKRFF